MDRKFLTNILFLVLLNLLIKPFWFLGIEVAVQNKLSNELYGMYFSLLSFAMVFNFMLDLGITNFNNREIARHNHLVSRYFSNIIALKLLLGLFYVLLCIAGSLVAGYGALEIKLLLFLILNQFLASFILYLRSNINGLLMFMADSLLSVLDKGLMILILSLLLWGNFTQGIFKVEWFIYSQTLAYLITAITAFVLVIRKCAWFSPNIDFRYLIIILRKSLPFSVLVLLMLLYNRIEPILLERLLPDGKTQAGIYAQGFRIVEVLTNFAYLFPVLLLPLFAKMLKSGENINSLVALSASILVLPSIVISTACAFYGANIMNMLYHQPASGAVFSTLIFGFSGIAITYLYGTLLTANGNLKYLNIMAASAVIFNICLNLFLIPRYAAQGAAISSCVTQCGTAIVQMLMAYKILHINIQKRDVIKVLFWASIFLIAAYSTKLWFENWILGFISISIFGFLLLFAFRLVKIREMIALLLVSKKETI